MFQSVALVAVVVAVVVVVVVVVVRMVVTDEVHDRCIDEHLAKHRRSCRCHSSQRSSVQGISWLGCIEHLRGKQHGELGGQIRFLKRRSADP